MERWVIILKKVGDYHRDGGLIIRRWSVNVLRMEGEPPWVNDGLGEDW